MTRVARKRALNRSALNRKELLAKHDVGQLMDINELEHAPLNFCGIYLVLYNDFDTQQRLYGKEQQKFENDDCWYFMVPLLMLQISNTEVSK